MVVAMQTTNNVDKAGPLWLAIENLFESLPAWVWLAVGGCIALAVFVALLLALRKRT